MWRSGDPGTMFFLVLKSVSGFPGDRGRTNARTLSPATRIAMVNDPLAELL
jgi:hypothetical protein